MATIERLSTSKHLRLSLERLKRNLINSRLHSVNSSHFSPEKVLQVWESLEFPAKSALVLQVTKSFENGSIYWLENKSKNLSKSPCFNLRDGE